MNGAIYVGNPVPIRTARHSPSLNLNAFLEQKTKEKLEELSVFHRGDGAGKFSIQQSGFDARLKSRGLTQATTEKKASRGEVMPQKAIDTAARHHYFTKNKQMAKFLARMVSPNNPAVTTVLATSDHTFEVDPEAMEGLRVPNSTIDKRYVKGAPGSGEILQRELAKDGVDVPLEICKAYVEVDSDFEDER